MPPANHAAKPGRLTRAQIRAELAKMFHAPNIGDADDIGDYFDGGPGAVAAFWEPLVEWQAFAERGLELSPNDLRFVTTIGELISVIDWGLRRAKS
jgi:hypothetical protein